MIQANMIIQLEAKKQLQYKEDYQPIPSIKTIVDIKKQIAYQIEQSAIMMKIAEEIHQNEELIIQRQAEQFKEAFEKEFKVEFKLTSLAYDLSVANYDDICEKNFGQEFRVAEWTDLEDVIYELEESKINQFISYLGFSITQNDFALRYNSHHKYSQSRYYFVSWHNHKKPDCYLAHDNINNYLLSLGSWVGSKRILCIQKIKEEQKDQSIIINEEDGY